MATYSTDLTTRDTADAATNFVELTGTIGGFTLSGAGNPAADGENYIQGVDCVSQTTGKAVDAEISLAYDHGTNLTFTTGHVVFHWCFYAVGVNLKTKANDGWMYVIADSLTTGDYFTFGGSDSGRNPYGGWTNVAIDPTATQTGTLGAGGNSGNYRYFGHVCNTLNEISKGTPSAVDAIRTGRGEISVTGTGGSFSEMASYNDWNSTATPPGTSSTVKDSGYHRLGLFQENGGTYLWKGMMALGLTGTSVTFSDSNETIIIDDCPFTYPAFNKIEVRNASSSVTLTNITFISTATTANGVGHFEMVDNATVSLSGCSFNNMGTFVFDTNGTITGSSFNSCGQITHGGADFDSCVFQGYEGTTDTGYMIYDVAGDPSGELDNCSFTKGTAATHAIEFDATTSPTTISLVNVTFTGYGADTTTSAAILIKRTTGTVTINVSGGTTPTYKSLGATVVIQSTVTFSLSNVLSGSTLNLDGVFTTDTPSGSYNGTGDTIIQFTGAIPSFFSTSGTVRVWNGSYYDKYTYTGVSGQQLTGISPSLTQDYNAAKSLLPMITPKTISADPHNESVVNNQDFECLIAYAGGGTPYQPVLFNDNTGSGFSRRVSQIVDA